MATCRSLVQQCARQLRHSCRPSLQSRQCLTPLRRAYATSVAAAELKFGQPLHETHPHILSPGERRYLSLHWTVSNVRLLMTDYFEQSHLESPLSNMPSVVPVSPISYPRVQSPCSRRRRSNTVRRESSTDTVKSPISFT